MCLHSMESEVVATFNYYNDAVTVDVGDGEGKEGELKLGVLGKRDINLTRNADLSKLRVYTDTAAPNFNKKGVNVHLALRKQFIKYLYQNRIALPLLWDWNQSGNDHLSVRDGYGPIDFDMDALKKLIEHDDNKEMFKVLKDNNLLIPDTEIPFAPHIQSIRQVYQEGYEILEQIILPGAVLIIVNKYKAMGLNPLKVIAHFDRLFFREDVDIDRLRNSYALATYSSSENPIETNTQREVFRQNWVNASGIPSTPCEELQATLYAIEHSDMAKHFRTFIKECRSLWNLQSKGFNKPHEKAAFVDDDVEDFVHKFIQIYEQFVQDSVISRPVNRIRPRVNLVQGAPNNGFEDDNDNEEYLAKEEHALQTFRSISDLHSPYTQLNIQSEQKAVPRQNLADPANYRTPQDTKVIPGASRGTRRAPGSQAKDSQQTKTGTAKGASPKTTYPVPDPQESDKIDVALANKLTPNQQFFCRRRYGPGKVRCGKNHRTRLCTGGANVKLVQVGPNDLCNRDHLELQNTSDMLQLTQVIDHEIEQLDLLFALQVQAWEAGKMSDAQYRTLESRHIERCAVLVEDRFVAQERFDEELGINSDADRAAAIERLDEARIEAKAILEYEGYVDELESDITNDITQATVSAISETSAKPSAISDGQATISAINFERHVCLQAKFVHPSRNLQSVSLEDIWGSPASAERGAELALVVTHIVNAARIVV